MFCNTVRPLIKMSLIAQPHSKGVILNPKPYTLSTLYTVKSNPQNSLLGGTTRCISITLDGDIMYVLGGVHNVNATDSDAFEGCPEAPVAFLDGGTARPVEPSFDLTAAGANFAITLRRTPEVWIGGHRSWFRGQGFTVYSTELRVYNSEFWGFRIYIYG